MTTHGYRGKLIVFEGIDGAGTTTQAERYAEHVRQQRRLIHVTRQPSDGPIGSMLRLALSGRLQLGASNQAQTMALLFAADRLDHLAHEIEPLLRDGYVVVCDRYDLSSLAYQTATAPAAALESFDFAAWVRSLNRFALRPDATLVIDVSSAEAEKRRRARLAATELYERVELQETLAGLYARAEELVPHDLVLHVDGEAPVDDVFAAVCAQLADVIA